MWKATVAVLAVAAAGAVLYQTMMSKKGKSSEGEEEELAPALTEEETVKIMGAILDKVKILSMRMMQAAENIKAQLAQNGQEMDERKLMLTFIHPHFMEQLEQIQSAVLGEYEAEESELEDAVNVYVNTDAQVREIVDKIKLINYQFGGDRDEEAEESGGLSSSADAGREVTLDELIEVLNDLTENISEGMDEYITEFKETHGVPDESNMELFHHGFMRITEELEKEVLKQRDISTLAFQRAVEKNSQHRALQEAFAQMQITSASKMREHGLQ
jgi:hypothetical protein